MMPPFGYDSLAYFTRRFSIPLENVNVDCSLLQQEWDYMVDYGKMYINLTENYTGKCGGSCSITVIVLVGIISSP